MARRTITLLLALACALALCATPALAAQDDPPAGQEYNLDLPGGDNAPAQQTDASDADSGSGGFPVVVVVLVAGAGLAAGIAAWRMRKPNDPPEGS